MSKPELLKKISAKTVLGGKIEKPEKAAHLFRVVGVVTGLAVGTSNFGEWVAFKGEFRVVRHDGAEFYGVKLFLPDPAQTLLVTAFKTMGADSGAHIEVALDIGIKPSDVPIGYEYTATPLVEVKTSDPLTALLARVEGKSAPALPAPKVKTEAPRKSKSKSK